MARNERSLGSLDTDAVTDAVDALEEHGFQVQHVDDVETAGQGVSFTMDVRKLTQTTTLGGQS